MMTPKRIFLAIGVIAILGAVGVMLSLPHNHKYTDSVAGFSFNYPSGFYVLPDPDTSTHRLYVLPNSLKGNSNEPIRAIVISVSDNSSEITPLEWIKSPNSGYDISQGYHTGLVGGQQSMVVEGGDWVVVDTPDVKKQISIALLTPKGGVPLQKEMDDLLNSFAFR